MPRLREFAVVAMLMVVTGVVLPRTGQLDP